MFVLIQLFTAVTTPRCLWCCEILRFSGSSASEIRFFSGRFDSLNFAVLARIRAPLSAGDAPMPWPEEQPSPETSALITAWDGLGGFVSWESHWKSRKSNENGRSCCFLFCFVDEGLWIFYCKSGIFLQLASTAVGMVRSFRLNFCTKCGISPRLRLIEEWMPTPKFPHKLNNSYTQSSGMFQK